ncbi:arginase family protein [Rhodoferax koreensis]|uniref:arginase family protein n=1 Tax=Rhodoferax koreensis TaxID=1842727 RepID=UPI001EF4C031|nr:arginase family protein [Rhodoferax koreense]
MNTPVVLDLDGAVGALPGAQRLALQDRQEALRFGCGLGAIQSLKDWLDLHLPAQHGTVFMGSGDFHHLSWPLIAHHVRARASDLPLRVVVLDNHPDNMRFPFGVHCGSWVRRVALMPEVREVIVAGICSGDIGWRHAWENQLAPLLAGKLSYWSVGVDTGWARWLGLARAFRNFADAQSLTDALVALLQRERQATYLSIDKDVFAPEVVRTNWDQGGLLEAQAMAVIDALRGQLVGSDVTGEVSAYRYHTAWKRWLSAQDGQDTAIDPAQLALWQDGQHALNLRLLRRLDSAHS